MEAKEKITWKLEMVKLLLQEVQDLAEENGIYVQNAPINEVQLYEDHLRWKASNC